VNPLSATIIAEQDWIQVLVSPGFLPLILPLSLLQQWERCFTGTGQCWCVLGEGAEPLLEASSTPVSLVPPHPYESSAACIPAHCKFSKMWTLGLGEAFEKKPRGTQTCVAHRHPCTAVGTHWDPTLARWPSIT